MIDLDRLSEFIKDNYTLTDRIYLDSMIKSGVESEINSQKRFKIISNLFGTQKILTGYKIEVQSADFMVVSFNNNTHKSGGNEFYLLTKIVGEWNAYSKPFKNIKEAIGAYSVI